jgi:hypothetical protein
MVNNTYMYIIAYRWYVLLLTLGHYIEQVSCHHVEDMKTIYQDRELHGNME